MHRKDHEGRAVCWGVTLNTCSAQPIIANGRCEPISATPLCGGSFWGWVHHIPCWRQLSGPRLLEGQLSVHAFLCPAMLSQWFYAPLFCSCCGFANPLAMKRTRKIRVYGRSQWTKSRHLEQEVFILTSRIFEYRSHKLRTVITFLFSNKSKEIVWLFIAVRLQSSCEVCYNCDWLLSIRFTYFIRKILKIELNALFTVGKSKTKQNQDRVAYS